jgi:hypothetical protein
MTTQIERSKNPRPRNPSGPPTPKEGSLPVFNPNRWLWDFKEEKPQRLASPSGPARGRSNQEIMIWNLVSALLDLIFAGVLCFLFLWGVSRLLDLSIKTTALGLWRLSPSGSGLLFFSFLWVYHVALPALVSYTPGQWACHITRTPSEINFAWVLRSTLRLFWLAITGFVTLPLFSWAAGVDLEETLSGLKLISK